MKTSSMTNIIFRFQYSTQESELLEKLQREHKEKLESIEAETKQVLLHNQKEVFYFCK